MNGAVDVGVLGDDSAEQVPVRDITLAEGAVAHEGPGTGEQRVEDHRRVPRHLERLRGCRTDVAGAAGDQDLHGRATLALARPSRGRGAGSCLRRC